MITVITPTYNRGKELKKLYISLRRQSEKNFKWLIIDDGSTDDTDKIVADMKKQCSDFDIVYKKKKNGGKHTALNMAFSLISSGLALVVDSDDYLVQDAIECIRTDWRKYSNRTMCGLCYKRMRNDSTCICDDFGEKVVKANYNSFIINGKIKGDKAEVFRADVLSKIRFPEYEDEKFLGEGVMWSIIAHKYNMIFINRPIYVCEYLEGGLTNSGRGMRVKNPKGGMFHAEEYIDRRYRFSIRERNAILYLIYARFAGFDIFSIVGGNKYKLLLSVNLIPSYLLFVYWRKKYGGRKK